MQRTDYVELLFSRRYLLEGEKTNIFSFYYAAYLANKYAVVVDNPRKLCPEIVADVEAKFGAEVPKSFYENPQDTKYYTCGQLLIEQLVSYFMIEGNEKSENSEIFDNPELFDKVLPRYSRGKESVKRKYHVVSKEEADKILADIMANYCTYTRPWSEDEIDEIRILLSGNYYNGEELNCRDNIATMFCETKDVRFAEQLDRKDVVKMSLAILGDNNPLLHTDEEVELLKIAALTARPCPLTKKQAKYFNKIIKFTGAKIQNTDNSQSPYVAVKKIMAEGDVVGAAEYLKSGGNLLTRNLVWLLSRAKENEVDDILKKLVCNSPIAYIQFLYMLVSQGNDGRVFKFFYNGKMKTHIETEEEIAKRRSFISEAVRQKTLEAIRNNIKTYYKSKQSLGKIYVSDYFKNVFVPMNTSASGKGIDILPIGSRIPVKGDYIRVFCYWHKAFDIDLSVVFEKENGKYDVLSWLTYTRKPFGNSALSSGDDRNKDGAEYVDFDLNEVKKLGWKYALVMINGYGDTFDKGEIYCGYQDKNDLNTKAWMPNNIAMKMHVKGECRQFSAFALDIEKKEIIVLNLLGQDKIIAVSQDIEAVAMYLDPRNINAFNMYDVITSRGELVDDPKKAQLVFDEKYEGKEGQSVVRPWDVEKLVSLTV